MVLRYCLPMDAFCTLGHVVDHGCDTPVESFIVHSPLIEQVERGCEWRRMHRSKVSYTIDESVYIRVYKRLSK